jgi:RNA polymerase sigma-70 factor (ECF subfamily)
MGRDTTSQTGSTLLVLLSDPTDARAWGRFVERYGPKVYRWCRQWHLQEADAQDVTQNVLTQMVQKLRSFCYDPSKGTFRGWLKTVTHHAWRDYLESQSKAGLGKRASSGLERLQSLEAREDLLSALEDAFDLEVLAEAQARVQLQVTTRDWKIFQALAVEGRSGPDVAQELGMNVTAVLVAKCRVQKKLRVAIHRLEEATTSRTAEERA